MFRFWYIKSDINHNLPSASAELLYCNAMSMLVGHLREYFEADGKFDLLSSVFDPVVCLLHATDSPRLEDTGDILLRFPDQVLQIRSIESNCPGTFSM